MDIFVSMLPSVDYCTNKYTERIDKINEMSINAGERERDRLAQEWMDHEKTGDPFAHL